MMTENERARVRGAEEAAHKALDIFEDENLPSEIQAQIVGTLLATVDALFAIRDGQSWRGMSDPQEITKQVLRDAQLGDGDGD